MKHTLIIFLLLCGFSFSQVIDSTKSLGESGNSSTAADTGKTVLQDSLKHTTQIDTLAPLYQNALGGNSFFIPREQINMLDYRNAGDLLSPFDFHFIRDQGFIGQPNEVSIYGAGYNSISFLEDGVLFNNRFTNSLDLNLVQTEYIDSIEIVPLPRGFLYSPYNNNVTVNYITKDFLSRPPYTRLKYYQGPNGEASVDVLFNSWMYKRFNASFDISNHRADSSYTNSNFSVWQLRLKLKYLLSNKINVIGNYNYTVSRVGLNGGVDYTQIVDSTINDISSILYDPQLAPVIYSDRNEQTKMHNVSIKLLGRFLDNSKTDVTLYYRSNFDAISGSLDTNYFAYTDRNKIYGASLNHEFSTSLLNLSLIGNYEKYDLNYDVLFNSLHPAINYNASVYSLSVITTVDPDNKILVPSVFYKISHNSLFPSEKKSTGYGLDLKTNFSDNFTFYAGYSFYNQNNSGDINNFELSGEFRSDLVSGGLRYFSRKGYYVNNLVVSAQSLLNLPHQYEDSNPLLGSNYNSSAVNGMGGHLILNFWKIILNNSAAYYFDTDNPGRLFSSVHEFTYRGGLYYTGLLFNDNLDLKTGIVFYYTGKRSSITNASQGFVAVNSTHRLDFTLVGVIQKVATIYFAWENLLNSQYYIVPYYPMPERNIRFGIAWELFN